MDIQFLGAARTVTGSCYRLGVDGGTFLVDCGFRQGRNSDALNREPFAFEPARVDAVFLTHAHLDHSGLLPRLVKEGFRGRIVTTDATADLIGPMLIDSARIQEGDAEWLSKKAVRAGREPVEPLYTTEDAEKVLPLVQRTPYGKQGEAMGVRFRFVDAGHILGSGSLELLCRTGGGERTVVFSGDIGKKGTPIINDPTYLEQADAVVMESTYGDRMHKGTDDTVAELADAVRTTFQRGGNVIIPAFSIGRTQDILYILGKLVREGKLPKLNVYVDSPLAEKATRAYLAHPECFDEEAQRLLSGRIGEALAVRFTGSAEESRSINAVRSKAIIMAGSGMCEGGRVRHHLKHNLWRPECSVVFVGFQAQGTMGRRIVDGASSVSLWGEDIAVRARIHTIGGFSAHADQAGLLEWLSAFRGRPRIFVTHGEEQAALAFAEKVRERYGFVTAVPRQGETVAL